MILLRFGKHGRESTPETVMDRSSSKLVHVTVAAVIAGAQLARVVLFLLVTLEKRQLGDKVRALESGLGCV